MKRIHTVETVEEAHLLISMLESYEIPCELTNDYIVAVDPLMSNAVHGIDIFVDEEFVEDAKAILGVLDEDKGDKQCPHCGSAKIRYLRFSWWNMLFYFAGFILPIGKRRMYCLNCLEKFREDEVLWSDSKNSLDDKLVEEALSYKLEEPTIKELPSYMSFFPGFIFSAALCLILSPLYYLKFGYFPKIASYFKFALVGGGLFFFLSYTKKKRRRAFAANKKTDSDED